MARILVIEDDDIFRMVLSRMLERLGHQVSSAANGNLGLRAMSQTAAELVITDLVMPEREGIETIRELRKNYPGTKIIAMSGGSSSEIVRQNLQCAALLGASKILAKPFGIDELTAALRTVFEKVPTID